VKSFQHHQGLGDNKQDAQQDEGQDAQKPVYTPKEPVNVFFKWFSRFAHGNSSINKWN
jgi:hypothetical protein